jgi:NAD(P)-dependent dehydrogenase (short-subunit alcohol dehydrogenase family)
VQLAGRSAVVTGGAGGLGEAAVRALVEAGARVVVADLAEEKGTALAKALGDGARFVSTDVTDEASVQAALDAAGELGPLRVAVVVHGGHVEAGRVVGKKGPLSLDGYRRTLEHYLTGTFNVLRLAAAAMGRTEPDPEGGRGVVITTASIAGIEGQTGQIAYGAAKAGVIGMTLPAARDLSILGIRVCTIAPGTFYTPAFGAHFTEEEASAKFGQGIQFPSRMGRPSEYGQLVRSIAENDYLNGEVIRIDGALRFPPKGG